MAKVREVEWKEIMQDHEDAVKDIYFEEEIDYYDINVGGIIMERCDAYTFILECQKYLVGGIVDDEEGEEIA